MNNKIDLEDILEQEDNGTSFKDWLDNEFENKEEEITTPLNKINNEEFDIESVLIKTDIDPEKLDKMQREMYDTIRQTDRIGWERGEGFKTGFRLLDEKLMGIQPGLAFLGAQSNVGKSSFLLAIAYQSTLHDKLFSLYFSLDDSSKDLLPRIVANRKHIPINSIRLPMKYSDYPTILNKREEGIKELYESISRFKVVDQDKGKTIESIEKTIEEHYNYLQKNNIDRKLFVQVDNFHDLTSEKNFYDDKQLYGYIAGKLREIAEKYDIPIWCTAELRKFGAGANKKRPTKDDIREAGKIVYEATLCLMLYNEVGLEQQNATVFYRSPDKPGKCPVLEVHMDKNKQSDFKGRLYYEFVTDYALFVEAVEEEVEHYNNLVYQG